MNELNIKKINDEVFFATQDIVRFDMRAIDFVKAKALENARGRARICTHKNSQDTLHEMLIAIRNDSYIRPHRHHNKIESFHLIEGRADIVIFSDDGEISDVVRLGKEFCFYYRLNLPSYHTLIIHSDVFVIHETTNGPFDIKASDYAAFSPTDDDKSKSAQYLSSLREKIAT